MILLAEHTSLGSVVVLASAHIFYVRNIGFLRAKGRRPGVFKLFMIFCLLHHRDTKMTRRPSRCWCRETTHTHCRVSIAGQRLARDSDSMVVSYLHREQHA